MPAFLPRILDSRRDAVRDATRRVPPPEMEARARDAAPPRDFTAALRADGMSLIAEVKRASPSRGDLRPDLDAAGQAAAYARGGARAVSVLTEPAYFKGSPEDLAAARAAVKLPVLWKDFVIDPYQVAWARATGADAFLVIVRICDAALLHALLEEADRFGMAALVEVFDESDLDRALTAGAQIIGVNHRDLETFEEDPQATARLRPRIPKGVVCVGESAILAREDVAALEAIGVDAVLVGEALVVAPDPAGKIRELLGR